MNAPEVSWEPVRDFVRRASVVPTTIAAGTPEWCALADDDPRKLAALIIAGSRWVLECDLAQRDQLRASMKDAAVAVSKALDWARVARRIRDRDQWRREHPDLNRKSA